MQADGSLQLVGVAQEQHGDRTKLFMQWKKMKWPVFVDSFNLLDVSAVPIAVFLDEHGIIRAINPKLDELSVLLAKKYDEPSSNQAEKEVSKSHAVVMEFLDGEIDTSSAIKQLQAIEETEPKNARVRFRTGVMFRKRFDSMASKANDFSNAIDRWKDSLGLNPNQYIWRRRIQQYGPRLDKPYSFYDWVPLARKEIAARGETPTPLSIEPTGAEFAKPQSKVASSRKVETPDHPDPNGQITRDKKSLVQSEVIVVPSTKRNAKAYRVHVRMEPNHETDVHWNNENDPPTLFLDPVEGWRIEQTMIVGQQNGDSATSDEPRVLEFELRPIGDDPAKKLSAAVFYYVCEGKLGVCRFLRKDLEFDFTEN